MTIKSFNVNEDIYAQFAHFCKAHGVSMSKQVELFMESQIEDDPKAKAEYLEKLERIRKGRFVRVDNFAKYFGLE